MMMMMMMMTWEGTMPGEQSCAWNREGIKAERGFLPYFSRKRKFYYLAGRCS